MAPIPRPLDYAGPAVLSYGFRPFYLLGSLYAGFAVLAWLAITADAVPPFGVFSGRDWHVHELLFGYLAAVIAGYLLTAVPNWTGKLPMQGKALFVLVLTWLAGRSAVSLLGEDAWLLALAADNAFLLLMTFVVAREAWGGAGLRNVGPLAALFLLLIANITFHLEARWQGAGEVGLRLGIATIVGLITLIGGRIIPSFTRNWLARQPPGRFPSPFGLFDRICIAVGVAALALWVTLPYAYATGFALLIAGGVHALRLARWEGGRTWRNPLIFVLHVGYLFVPAGFVLTALAAFGLLFPTAGIHAWTAGAMGVMTLAVMTRTSLGLTGRPRVAGIGTVAIYVLAVSGALLRLWPTLDVSAGDGVLHAAGSLWALAFLGYAIVYWPILMGPRPIGKGRRKEPRDARDSGPG